MPRYKKKKHNRILNAPKRMAKTPIKNNRSEDNISMTSLRQTKAKVNNEERIKVVSGGKAERRRKTKTLISFAIAVALIFSLLQLLLPAGVVQTVSNIAAVVGTGSYPIAVSGSETLSVVPYGNYFFHLTDTHISAYSNGGKILFSEAHGYEKAVLATSKGRALLYNQGGEQFSIYDLKGQKLSANTENEIICGDISDSGSYALVTYSDSYASAVAVYGKKGKTVFEWYSAEDIINNVAISSSGKKIAVSTFNSANGVFNSKVNIINFKSATPEYTKSYENQIIYGLEGSNKSVFNIIKSNGIDSIKWSKHKENQYTDDYRINYFRDSGSLNIGVFTRESDKTDNKIVIFSKNGNLKSTVQYKGVINDIQLKGSNIYCINDTSVIVLDFDGKIKFNAEYGFGGAGVSVSSANVVIVITNNDIKQIKLKERV